MIKATQDQAFILTQFKVQSEMVWKSQQQELEAGGHTDPPSKNSHECALLPSVFTFSVYPIQDPQSKNSPAQRQDRSSHINEYN